MKKNLRLLLCLAIGWLAGTSAWAIEPVDGVYQIGTAQDWSEFCTLHNEGSNQTLNAVLTADIVVEGNSMIGINGSGKPFRGTFDGQGHKLTVSYDLNEERVAPFRRINGAKIKNLIVEGTINTSSKLASGLVGGLWQSGSLIQNCVSYVTITDTNTGDATHGGICGSFEDVNGANTIENCAFLGTINAPNREGCGGIVGWTNNNNRNNIIRNCLVNAHGFNVLRLSNNDIICRNNGNVENCYFIGSTDGIRNEKGGIQATDAQAVSGELCFLLNGSQSETPTWFQTIGTDEMPSPLGTGIVYANGTLKCDGTPKGDVSYSNTQGEAQRDEHQYSEWGFCSVCDAMQPDFLTPDAEGYYPIATKQAYNWFMTLVNNKKELQAKARLTQDLDLSDYTFVPIGSDVARYAGTFDGQGFRIQNMTLNGTVKEQAFFSVLQGGAVVKNLIIDSSCKMEGTGGSNVAALVACINGSVYGDVITIENVGNEMSFDVTTTNNAGFVARDWSGNLKVQITNSYNTGSIMGGVENGAFTAWTPRVTLTNCWNTGRIEKTGGYDGSKSLARGNQPKFINSYDLNSENTDNAGAPTGYAADWMASGQLCYIMNGNQSTDVAWYQKIGEDEKPMPFAKEGAVVYANGALMCDGITPKEGSELTFSNTEGSTIDDHQFTDGFCEVCHKLQPDYLSPAADGAFEIANEKQLNWFAAYVNQAETKNIDGRLTADVDFSGYQIMIGNGDNDDAYAGTFDGQGHQVTLAYEASQKNVALFRYLNNATIKNLITNGTVINENSSCAGGIFAGSRGATVVENCVSYVNFSRTSGGDATVGGIGAYMHDNGTLSNCAFLGTIDTPAAEGNGGLLGYANGGGNVSVKNCLVNASAFNVIGNSVSVARNTGNLTNTYVVNCGTATQPEALTATEAQLASGELCYLLNGKVSGGTSWYQLIGTDDAPLPIAKEGAVVYTAGSLKCDGTPKDDVTYANTESEMQKDDHTFTDGICEVCGTPNENYLQPNAEGAYVLATAQNVVWFAAMVNRVNPAIDGVLATDLDFEGIEFPGIGTSAAPYKGSFEGQCHIISNLIIDQQEDESTAGFFNVATAGASIKNFTIDNSCYITGHHYVGAFVGCVNGNGGIVLEQLGNEADVQAWNQNAGGILGCNFSGELKLKIVNCYNAGAISSERESGGISGWLGDHAELINCYNMGEVSGDGSESFARGNDIRITNCFDPVSDWAGTELLTPMEDFTNGTVYQKLAEAAPGIWYLSDETNGHPVLYNTGITTGIETMHNEHCIMNNASVYDLQGRHVDSPLLKKGLYIVGGKKVVVK